jgi:hypothetical protein
MVIEEMFGGQHRSDEGTRAERVGWTQNSDRRRKQISLGKGRTCAERMGVLDGEEEKIQRGKKDEETS